MLTGSIGNSSFELYMPYTGTISTKPVHPYVHNCKQQVWLTLPGGIPCSKLVLQTSNSAVAGLPILTAVLPSSCRLKYSKFSEREQSAQVRISVNPHMAHSTLSSSTSWFKGSSLPIVTVAGTLKPTLLYPYAIATSCGRTTPLRRLLPNQPGICACRPPTPRHTSHATQTQMYPCSVSGMMCPIISIDTTCAVYCIAGWRILHSKTLHAATAATAATT